MKTTLIITAHPSSSGFTHRVATAYADGITAAGGTAEIVNLYESSLTPPPLRFEDKKDWPHTPDLVKMRAKISTADELVVVFPVWWGDCPGVMKNWFDTTFASGFAFRYGSRGPEGLLRGKTAKIFATADGPGWLYSTPISPLRINWQRLRFPFCGVKVTTFRVWGSMRKKSDADRKKILAAVRSLAMKK